MIKYIYSLLFTVTLCSFAACTTDNDEIKPPKDEDTELPKEDEDEPEASYTSYWYYSYEAANVLSAKEFGLEASQFLPGYSLVKGDTLFLANNANAQGRSLLVYNLKSRQMIKTIDSWTEANGTETPIGVNGDTSNNIEAMTISHNILMFVVRRGSFVYTYKLPSLEPLVRFGHQNYNSSSVSEAQAMVATDEYLFARQKNGSISIFKMEEFLKEEVKTINRFAVGKSYGNANNNWAPMQMVAEPDGTVLLTENNGKKVRVIDPKQITAEMQGKTNVEIEDPTKTIELEFNPLGVARVKNRLYYIANSPRTTHVYDEESQTLSSAVGMQKMHNHQLGTMEKITAQDSTLWITDIHANKRNLVQVTIHKNEVREYEKVDARTIRVTARQTRSGEPETFLVDLRTHEIVE